MGRLGVNEVIVDRLWSRGGSWGPQLFDGRGETKTREKVLFTLV